MSFSIAGDVLSIAINRPDKLNALSQGMLSELAVRLKQYEMDTTIKVVTIRGRGGKAFSSGGDLVDAERFRERGSESEFFRAGWKALDALRFFPVPTIAILDGFAIGGGAELAMACDFRVATESAAIGLVHSQLALVPEWGGNIDLIECIGPCRAMHLMASGDMVPADAALEMGLLDVVYANDNQLGQCLHSYIEQYIKLSRDLLVGLKAPILIRRRKAHDALAAESLRRAEASWTSEIHWSKHDRLMRDLKRKKIK